MICWLSSPSSSDPICELTFSLPNPFFFCFARQYDHPGAGTVMLDSTFQYYGTAKTLQDGTFWFKTHRPGIYSGRPTHIHFKVWVGGVNILTSQYYFSDENTSYPSALQLELQEETTEEGITYFSTSKTIRVNLNLGGSGPFTPSDQEGPFYPVSNFFDFDNDLTNTTAAQDFDEGTLIPTVSPSASPSIAPSSAAPATTNNEGSMRPTTFDDVLPTSSPSGKPFSDIIKHFYIIEYNKNWKPLITYLPFLQQ